MAADQPIDEGATRSDLVHERLRESPFRRWVLLDGDRNVLAGTLSVAVFASTAMLGFGGFVPVTDPDAATALVGSIVGGTLPFITIVLAINQLVLSAELGWPGDLAARFEGMTDFRRNVEATTGDPVSPAAPSDFLRRLVETIDERARDLSDSAATTAPGERDRTAAESGRDSALGDEFDDVTTAITSEAAVVEAALEGADFGTFDALAAVLGNFNGAHRHAVRLLRDRHADALDEATIRTIDELVELLGHLAVARQSFKTMYMQYELAHLSKLLLYVGFPTLLGGGLFTMTYGSIIAAVGDPAALVLVVSAVVTLVFLPFVVLLVYTFRIATIASRTADFGPFVPRVDMGSDESGPAE